MKKANAADRMKLSLVVREYMSSSVMVTTESSTEKEILQDISFKKVYLSEVWFSTLVIAS
jgi:hypothetical protein